VHASRGVSAIRLGSLAFDDAREAKILVSRAQPCELEPVVLQEPKLQADELDRPKKSLHLIDTVGRAHELPTSRYAIDFDWTHPVATRERIPLRTAGTNDDRPHAPIRSKKISVMAADHRDRMTIATEVIRL